MDDSIQDILQDRNIFHYKKYWLNAVAESLEEQILAIFSFGTIQDAISYQLDLTPLMIEKLRKLTIISLAMEHRKIDYSLLLSKCQINDTCTLEEYLITLQPIIECRLDQVGQSVTVVSCLDGRDVYCHEKPLPNLVLPPMTKDDIFEGLQRWKLKLQKQILE
ncbi:COP9 signalosome complex subunit 9 [Monosporozyma servazzii]